MAHHSQILIITDRKRVFGGDTDMITVLSLCAQSGDTPAIIDALEACRKHGLKHLDYYPGFVRIISRAFIREDDEYEEPESGIMAYSIDVDEGVSFLKLENDVFQLVHSDQPYIPVIDLTGYEYYCGEEPKLHIIQRVSDYYRFSSTVYPLTNEGLTEAIDHIMELVKDAQPSD